VYESIEAWFIANGNMSSPNNKTVKIVLLGQAGVGKTTFVKRHCTGEYEKRYIATDTITTSNLMMNTTAGMVNLQIVEYPGMDISFDIKSVDPNPDTTHYMVMFDVTSKTSYQKALQYVNLIRSEFGLVANIIVCGNKCETRDRKVQASEIGKSLLASKFTYFDISNKSNYNFEKPFLEIIRKQLGSTLITFVESPALVPPEITLHNSQPLQRIMPKAYQESVNLQINDRSLVDEYKSQIAKMEAEMTQLTIDLELAEHRGTITLSNGETRNAREACEALEFCYEDLAAKNSELITNLVKASDRIKALETINSNLEDKVTKLQIDVDAYQLEEEYEVTNQVQTELGGKDAEVATQSIAPNIQTHLVENGNIYSDINQFIGIRPVHLSKL